MSKGRPRSKSFHGGSSRDTSTNNGPWTTQSAFMIGVQAGSVIPIRNNLEDATKEGIVGKASGNGNTAFYVAFVKQDFELMSKIAKIAPPSNQDLKSAIRLFIKNEQKFPKGFPEFLCDLIINDTNCGVLANAVDNNDAMVLKFFCDHVSKRGEDGAAFVRDNCISIIEDNQDKDHFSVLDVMLKYKLIDPNIIDEEAQMRFVEDLARNGYPSMTRAFIMNGASVDDKLMNKIISGVCGTSDFENTEDSYDSLQCLVIALTRLDSRDLDRIIEEHTVESKENLSLILETVKEFRSTDVKLSEKKRARVEDGNSSDGKMDNDEERVELRQQTLGICNAAAHYFSVHNTQVQVTGSSQLAGSAQIGIVP